MAGRPRKAAVEELQSLEDCTRVMGELLIATAEEEAVLAEAALAVAKASQQFETRLNAARHAKRENEAALESYYYGHVTEIERDGQKFIQLVNGRMGRRDNPPKLVPLNKKWTWKTITIALREKFGLKYFHPTPEPAPDRDALKEKLTAEQLRDIGLKVEQEETFYIEPLRPEEPREVKA